MGSNGRTDRTCPPRGATIPHRALARSDNHRGLLYLIEFGAPVSKWDASKAKFDVISKSIDLGDLAGSGRKEATRQDLINGQEIPKGFEIQDLELGGQILRPVTWTYECREVGKTLSQRIWKPLDNESDPQTFAMIDIVPNIPESGDVPSKFAQSFVKGLSEKVQVIETLEPVTNDGVTIFEITTEEKRTVNDQENIFRVRYSLVADDKRGLLTVVNFTSLASQWSEYEPIFSTMSRFVKPYGASVDLSEDATKK